MRTGNFRRAFAIGAALSGSCAVSVPALAQPQDELISDPISEIIVTARRTEERLQDVPISMTVFNQEQLTNRNVTNAVDLALFTPSLSVNNNFGNDNTSFAIRGFNQDIGTAPSVGTYFGDVVVPRGPTQGTIAGDGVGPGAFFDLQNVQVLKGPQGTLFGRNTTGGAVLLVPQRPTSEFEGYAEASYGNFEMWRAQGVINAPLGDNVRFRLAVDHQEREGYLNNISGIGPEDFNDVNYTAVRASVAIDITPNVENYTIASYSESETNGPSQKLFACNPAGMNATSFTSPEFAAGLANFMGVFSCSQLQAEAATGTDFWDVQVPITNAISNVEQWQVINTTTWAATDTLTIKNIASYAQFKDFQRAALFGTNWQRSNLPPLYQAVFAAGVPAVFANIEPIPNGYTAHQATYTEELQLQGGSADRRFIYQVGAYFEWSDPIELIGNQSPSLAACVDASTLNCSDPLGIALTGLRRVPTNVGSINYTAGETTYRTRAAYAQSTYKLTDEFSLTGGVRYTSDEQRNESSRLTYNFPVTPPFTQGPTSRCTDPSSAPSCEQSLEKKSEKPTWMVSLDYKPVETVLLYAKYARGYRSGGVFANAPVDLRTFEPETVDNYELGLKTEYHGGVDAIFNVAAFYNDFQDQQIQLGLDPRPGAQVAPTTAIINAGQSRIYGVEVEASLTPVENLTFDLDYTYLNTEIQEIAPVSTIDPNYLAPVSAASPGDPLPLSPEHKYVISARYTLPLSDSIGGITLGASFVHIDEQLTTYIYNDPAILAIYGKNNGLLDSRDLVNAYINWNSIAGSRVDLSIFGTNLTNEEYFSFVVGLAGRGFDMGTLGEPRMYGVRLKYRFGE